MENYNQSYHLHAYPAVTENLLQPSGINMFCRKALRIKVGSTLQYPTPETTPFGEVI